MNFKNKVLICVGTGGVGKTTVAAAMGVEACRRGLKTLVLTIDPSNRLATALGTSDWDGREIVVHEFNQKGQFFAAMVRPDRVFEQFLMDSGARAEDIEALKKNIFYNELSSSLSGAQEFTSLQALYHARNYCDYDLIILDTPPAQNTLDFFEMPDHIYDLFSGSVADWFSSLSEPKGSLFRMFNRGSLLAFKAFETITGNQFLRELEIFFSLISKFRRHVRTVSAAVSELLADPQTGFVLVGRYDNGKRFETKKVLTSLKSRGYHLSGLVLNGAWPKADTKSLKQPTKDFFDTVNNCIDFQTANFERTLKEFDLKIKVLPSLVHSQSERQILRKLAAEFSNDA